MSVNIFELSDATASDTTGLVPYRKRRVRAFAGAPPTLSMDEAERWASTQPWYPRVRVRRTDARFFCWFVQPSTEAEFALLREMQERQR